MHTHLHPNHLGKSSLNHLSLRLAVILNWKIAKVLLILYNYFSNFLRTQSSSESSNKHTPPTKPPQTKPNPKPTTEKNPTTVEVKLKWYFEHRKSFYKMMHCAWHGLLVRQNQDLNNSSLPHAQPKPFRHVAILYFHHVYRQVSTGQYFSWWERIQ